MAEQVTFSINIDGNARQATADLSSMMDQLGEKINRQQTAFQKFATISTGLNQAFQLVKSTIGSAVAKLNECEQAFQGQMAAEAKLQQIMSNTMNATAEQVNRIKELTAAQQQLGIVGDEVQLAGAQELATYLGQTDSLEKLIPAMNDMIAQQIGFGATQEQAAGIASMLGKVMDGQVGALSRYGYKFDEAQAQVLKYGTEAEKVAVLTDVIGSAVGGVNAALAQTPEGRWNQIRMSLGDIQEQIGGLWVELRNNLLPLAETAIGWIQGGLKKLPAIINGVANAVVKFAPILAGITAGIVAYTVAVNAMSIATKIAAAWTQIWAGIQAVFNAIMAMNPISLIVIGIAALIAGIVYLSQHIKSFGDLWNGIWQTAKNIFTLFVDAIKYKQDLMINGIMIGLDKIKLGWYKFKEAVGLGDSNENKAAIAQINADVEARQKAITEGAKKLADQAKKVADPMKGVWKKGSNVSLIGNMNKATSATSTGATTTAAAAAQNTESVVTGGKKNTTVNITIGDMIKELNYNSTVAESAQDIERKFAETLSKVLGMAEIQTA